MCMAAVSLFGLLSGAYKAFDDGPLPLLSPAPQHSSTFPGCPRLFVAPLLCPLATSESSILLVITYCHYLQEVFP